MIAYLTCALYAAVLTKFFNP